MAKNSRRPEEPKESMQADEPFDVVIIGGGASGLSAALTLSRALRRVAVIDSGNPRNAPVAHMHGYLGYDGATPKGLLDKGRAEIETYGATLIDDTVTSAVPADHDDIISFHLTLAGGRQIQARRLLFSTGARDVLPGIPGLEALWGTDVHVCPFCHGYEVRDEPLAVIATGEHSAHYALMIRHWSADLICFENDRVLLTEAQEEQFQALGIHRVAGPVRRLVTHEGRLQAIEADTGEVYDRSAVFLSTSLAANTEVLETLGAETQETGQGSAVVVDFQGKTTVPGVWAAGNITNPSIQVIGAAAAGNIAGASINMDLIQEDQKRIVTAMLHAG